MLKQSLGIGDEVVEEDEEIENNILQIVLLEQEESLVLMAKMERLDLKACKVFLDHLDHLETRV